MRWLLALPLLLLLAAACTDTSELEDRVVALEARLEVVERAAELEEQDEQTRQPLRWSPAVVSVAEEIEHLIRIAQFVKSGASAAALLGEEAAAGWQRSLREECLELPRGLTGSATLMSSASSYQHLWPRSYRALDQKVAATCRLDVELGFWFTISLGRSPAQAAHVLLSDALDALPDYSPSQLRSAIAERE